MKPLYTWAMFHSCPVWRLTFAYSNGHSKIALADPEAHPAATVLSSSPPLIGSFYRMKSFFSHLVKNSSKTEKPDDLNTIEPTPAGSAPLYSRKKPSSLRTRFHVSISPIFFPMCCSWACILVLIVSSGCPTIVLVMPKRPPVTTDIANSFYHEVRFSPWDISI